MLSLRAKICLGFGILLIVTGGIAGISILGVHNLATSTTLITEKYVPEMKQLSDFESALSATRIQIEKFARSPTPSEAEGVSKQFTELQKHLASFHRLADASGQEDLQKSARRLDSLLAAYEDGAKDTIKVMLAGQSLPMRLTEERRGLYLAALPLVNKAETQWQGYIADYVRKAAEDVSSGLNVSYVLFAILVGLSLFIAVGIISKFSRMLKEGMAFAEEVAKGNFDVRWNSQESKDIRRLSDELNAAFDIVVSKMHWYESVINSVPYSISVTDMDMHWTFMNAAALKDTGFSELSQALGKHCSAKKGSLCNTPGCGIECLRRGKTRVEPILPDGRTIRIIMSYLKDRNGVNIGHVELGQDITEEVHLRKEAEEAMEKGRVQTAGELEEVVNSLLSVSTSLSGELKEAVDGAKTSASRIAEASTAMEEMNASVGHVAQSSGEVANVSNQAKDLALSGSGIVADVMHGLEELRETSASLHTDMQLLGTQAEAITRIMAVISDIADQTNLLALNAAIEAARAGEAGRGFAVVADEVRKLAEKTMNSTSDVAEAVKGIQQNTHKNVESVDIVFARIGAVTELAVRSDQVLHGIVDMVQRASEQMQNIATAGEEQFASSEEINRTLSEVNEIAKASANTLAQALETLGSLGKDINVLSRQLDSLKKDE